jgi:hypothetical protein
MFYDVEGFLNLWAILSLQRIEVKDFDGTTFMYRLYKHRTQVAQKLAETKPADNLIPAQSLVLP